MPTKEEIAAKILPRLTAKTLREFGWTDIVVAVGGASLEDKAAIGDAIRRSNTKRVGDIILRLVKDHARAAAQTKANTMMANSSLDLDELGQIL